MIDEEEWKGMTRKQRQAKWDSLTPEEKHADYLQRVEAVKAGWRASWDHSTPFVDHVIAQVTK